MSTVLISGARAPVALHLARLFHAAGHRVVLADSQRFPVGAATRMKHSYVRLPRARGNLEDYADAVEAAVVEFGCDLIVPTCEEVFYLAAARDLLGRALPLFAPDFAALAAVAHHKGVFAAEAGRLAGGPPRTEVVKSAAELRALGYSADRVLKPAWSRFAARTLVRPTPEQTALVLPLATDPWVVQDYLPGEEMCGFGVAAGGVLLAFAAYRPLYRAGNGAGIAFEPVEDSAARRFAADYAQLTGWTGQVSFDFRRDGTGALHAIECNPRTVSGVHFFGQGDGLVEAMLAGRPSAPSQTRAMTAPLAMLWYGLPEALRRRAVGQWWLDLKDMADIFAFPADRGFLVPQRRRIDTLVQSEIEGALMPIQSGHDDTLHLRVAGGSDSLR